MTGAGVAAVSGMGGMSGGGATMSGPMWMPTDSPTLGRLLAVHVQPVPIVPALSMIGLAVYLYAVVRLRRRGDGWPLWKTGSWVLGQLIVLGVTATGVEGYGMELFSVHMAQHMALAMVAPIFLLLGSPVSLALRTLPRRGRGAGVRRHLVRALGSRWLKVVSSIPVRWFLFLSGLYGVYFTGIFDGLMSSVWGHNVMMVHFVATGLLFFGPLVGADPWPTRSTPIMRMVETFASTPFHAFFGIAVMTSNAYIVGYFTHPPTAWGVHVLKDQNLAGGIAWATSELPTMIVMAIIFVQWIRSDSREAKAHGRAADRSGDADLVAYNAWLGTLSTPGGGADSRRQPQESMGRGPR